MSADSTRWFDDSSVAQQRVRVLSSRRGREFLPYLTLIVDVNRTVNDKLTQTINSHGASLCRVKPEN